MYLIKVRIASLVAHNCRLDSLNALPSFRILQELSTDPHRLLAPVITQFSRLSWGIEEGVRWRV